jgi:epoxyqueuosine reductase
VTLNGSGLGERTRLDALESELRARGFDIFVPFDLARIQEELEKSGAPWHGPGTTFSAAGSRQPTVGILIGNTRALWGPFSAYLTQSSDQEHPLDAYVEGALEGMFAHEPAARILLAHGPAGASLPIQRIAHATGALPLGPAHLNVHPDFGPWIALRAVVVGPGELAPTLATPAAHQPCTRCAAPCRSALERALSRFPEDTELPLDLPPELERLPLAPRERAWLRVRTVCPVGSERRYSAEQVHYHYSRGLKG